jgi:hypothetical protein
LKKRRQRRMNILSGRKLMLDLRFSQRWFWRVSYSRIRSRVVRWVSTNVSEERIASIFRVEEIGLANQRAIGQGDPEDGGDKFLRNVGWNLADYTASYPRRWDSSKLMFLEE